jgi:hypothetical protein
LEAHLGKIWKAGVGWVDERAVPIERQLQYYWEHVPRILQGFSYTRAQFPENIRLDGHGEELNTIFRLSCACGSTLHSVLGHYDRFEWNGEELTEFVAPLILRCEACRKQTLLIDTDVHGYDGECGNNKSPSEGRGTPEPGKCEACHAAAHEMYARFEYPDELLDEGALPAGKKPEDFFSWFSLIGKCEADGSYSLLADFECA